MTAVEVYYFDFGIFRTKPKAMKPTAMRYLLMFVLLIIALLETEASCLCKLKDDVKSNFEYADVVFVGKVLDWKTIRIWQDTTNARSEYNKYERPRGFYASSYSEFKRLGYSRVFTYEYTFEVSKAYKGKGKIKKKIIRIQSESTDLCGIDFKVGQEYLVYGRDDAKRHLKFNRLVWFERTKGTFETNLCTKTTNLENAAGQIAELKKL